MAVKIRLQRKGRRNSPFYRVVVAEGRTKREGKALAILGHYDPKKRPSQAKIDIEEYKKWISKGAQPTKAVKSLVSST